MWKHSEENKWEDETRGRNFWPRSEQEASDYRLRHALLAQPHLVTRLHCRRCLSGRRGGSPPWRLCAMAVAASVAGSKYQRPPMGGTLTYTEAAGKTARSIAESSQPSLVDHRSPPATPAPLNVGHPSQQPPPAHVIESPHPAVGHLSKPLQLPAEMVCIKSRTSTASTVSSCACPTPPKSRHTVS